MSNSGLYSMIPTREKRVAFINLFCCCRAIQLTLFVRKYALDVFIGIIGFGWLGGGAYQHGHIPIRRNMEVVKRVTCSTRSGRADSRKPNRRINGYLVIRTSSSLSYC